MPSQRGQSSRRWKVCSSVWPLRSLGSASAPVPDRNLGWQTGNTSSMNSRSAAMPGHLPSPKRMATWVPARSKSTGAALVAMCTEMAG